MCVLRLPLCLLLAGVLVYSEGTARSDSASVEIVVPPSPDVRDFMANCQGTTMQVEFYSWIIKGIEYKRKTLNDDDMACMSTEAVMLSVTGLAECAKAAAANDFNSFYVDAQDQCYASNLLIQDDGESCSQKGTVVYSSTVKVSEFTPSPPSITTFTIDDPVVATSFTVKFEAVCSILYTFRLSHGDEDLGNVRPGDVVPFDVPACSDVSLTLTPSLEGVPGDSVSAVYSPAVVPTVEGINVTDMEVDTITVHFAPICEGYTYKLFINDVDLGIIQSPKTVTSQEAPDILQPCAELEVRLEAQVQAGEDPYEISETIMTPSGPIVNSLTVTNVELDSIIVNFDPKCEGFEYKLFVDDEDVGVVTSPKTVTSAEAASIQSPCTELEVRLEAQVEDGADPYVISQSFTTADRPDVGSLNVTDIEKDQIIVRFDPMCDGFSYNLYVDGEDVGVVTNPKTLTSTEASSIQKPCTELEVRLEAQVEDGADPYEISGTFVTAPVPDVSDLEVTQLEDVTKFTVNFTPACPNIEYSVLLDNEEPIIIEEQEGMFTIQHPNMTGDLCTVIVFTVFVTGDSEQALGSYSEDFTLQKRGLCAFIDAADTTWESTYYRCPDGKSIINSPDVLGPDWLLELTQKFWLKLNLQSDGVWRWGNSQQLPVTDPLWASPPPTTGTTTCSVYDPVDQKVSPFSCLSWAALVCI